MELIKKMKKQINKFEITGEDLGIVISRFLKAISYVSQNFKKPHL